MGKNNVEKMAFAQILIRQGYTYRDIQSELKKSYGSGLSNTILKQIQDQLDDNAQLRAENEKILQELKIYKNLYFDLLEAMKKKL